MSATHLNASHLAHTLLDGIFAAMNARGDISPAEQATRSRDLMAVVASCGPQDALQTILIGQCLLFNEMIAEACGDVLAGMPDALKLRAMSGVSGLSRALHQNLTAFSRLREKSDALTAGNVPGNADRNAQITETDLEARQDEESLNPTPAETPRPTAVLEPAVPEPAVTNPLADAVMLRPAVEGARHRATPSPLNPEGDLHPATPPSAQKAEQPRLDPVLVVSRN